mgnify:CR=1 FL=1
MTCFTNLRFIKALTLIAVLASSLLSLSASAESLLQIIPTRVVLEQQRSTTLTVINRSDEDNSFRLFFRNIRAEDNGGFTVIAEGDEVQEGELFSDAMIRFSPRRVVIPARSKQQVRVVVRKPKGLADGEYRSHLVFRKLPKQASVLDETEEEEGLSFSITPIVEVTIPVIVRHGALTAQASLDNLALVNDEDEGEQLTLQISRDGNRSLYGEVNVWWMPNNGEKQRVSTAKGVAVYSPNTLRNMTLNLTAEPPMTGAGKLQAVFNEDPAYGGELNAEAFIER